MCTSDAIEAFILSFLAFSSSRLRATVKNNLTKTKSEGESFVPWRDDPCESVEDGTIRIAHDCKKEREKERK